ncbi:hypothetical protein [Vulgatibacter incomptus]|uniref:Uncharacterized protein n=1 Tax=Vulgatibacter incomptus TaxID=1391653 RepID=A0A0K1PA97_9BACT|nr:hypothetical protein [Vulgatibacter incomptus]AKU90440.1 hypothetical protein AKJ08_0827 [Vulgatibacter incomptus]
MFTGVKVFSATRARDREELGSAVSQWLATHRDLRIVDRVVVQSSDEEYHCLSMVIFYEHPPRREGSPRPAG